MGSRIFKMIGWGANNFTPPPDFKERIKNLENLSKGEAVQWLKDNKETIEKHSNPQYIDSFEVIWNYLLEDVNKFQEEHFTSLSDCVGYREGYGLPNHIIFVPIELVKQCIRYGDLIDWVEEGEDSRWCWLKKNISPFIYREIPVSVIALCVFLGLESTIPNLKEALYVFWR